MNENFAALDCIILFYIDKKHVLKVKQLDEKGFIEKLIEHCKQNRFDYYSDAEIKSTWYNLVYKFNHLKARGTSEERESWKYFQILDSCYEQSDFHSDEHSKFSGDMVWLLIECFLKRKTRGKTQKTNSLLNEIHKEILQSGYLHIMRHDIENKWKYLNAKYDQLKNDPESLKKFPFLQALKGFREADENVNMVFTTGSTKKLIEFYTEKKITCIIHGYDSDKVLSEIQSKFKNLGFNFGKEEIKEKWRTLMNIYKFLTAKGRKESSWMYFSDMQNHFKDNFLISSYGINGSTVNKINHTKTCLRYRSKMMGTEMKKRNFENTSCSFNKLQDRTSYPGKKIRKTSVRNCNSHKKLKGNRLNRSLQKNVGKNQDGNLFKSVQTNDGSKAFSQVVENSLVKKEIDTKPRLLRPRSKSVCTEQFKNSLRELVILLNPCHTSNEQHSRKHFEEHGKRRSPRKLKVTLEKKNELEHIHKKDILSTTRQKCSLIKNLYYKNDRRKNNNINTCTAQSRIQVAKLHSNIHSEDENLTINLRSDANNCSGNKYLPLKKKLRTSNTLPNISEHQKRVILPFSAAATQNNLSCNENGHLKVSEIMEIIHRNRKTSTTTNSENSRNCLNPVKRDKYHASYDTVQYPKIQKEDQTDGISIQADQEAQPPVLFLMLTVSNLSKNNTTKRVEDAVKPNTRNSAKSDKVIDALFDLHSPIDFVDSNSPKNKTVRQTEHVPGIPFTEINSIDSKTESRIDDDLKNSDHTRNSGFLIQNGQTATNYATSPSVSEQNKIVSDSFDKTTVLESGANIQSATDKTSPGKVTLPVKERGNLKEILVSPSELNEISKFKPASSFLKSTEVSVAKNSNESIDHSGSAMKFLSQVIKPAETSTKATDSKPKNSTASVSIENLSRNIHENDEEFENESIFSEAVGEDGVKDNLSVAKEMVRIGNLIKQNNLQQRETNRLLRLILEKM